MKIVCDSCGAKYSIADEKVAGKVFKIRCKKCSAVIVVRGDQVGAPAAEQPEEATSVYDYGADAVWHVVISGDQQGPFAPAQIGEMLTAGTIDWEAYVWREGFEGWLAARDVPELVQAVTGEPQEQAAPEQQPAAGPAGMGADPFSAAPDGAVGSPFAAAEGDPAAGYGAAAASYDGSQPAGFEAGAGAGLFAGGDAAFGDQAAAQQPGAGADLFGQQSSASPFEGGGEEDVVASGPGPRVSTEQAMTGQRNENSVLFSLANLQALATGSGAGGASPSPIATSPSPAGHAAGEGSGLIDIRALAGSPQGGGAPMGGGHAGQHVDELLSIGTGSPLGSVLGAPVLAPVQEEKSAKGMLFGIVAAASIIAIAAVVIVVILVTKTPEPVAQASGAPGAGQLAAAPGGGNGGAPTAAPGEGSQGAGPTSPGEHPAGAASAADPSPGGEAAAGPSPTGRTPSQGSGHRSPHTTGRRTHTGGGMSGAGGGSAQRPVSMMSSMHARSGSIDDLLNNALGMRSTRTMASSSAMAASNLPATPPRDGVLRALRSVQGAVSGCGHGQHGLATTTITVSGSSGRVTNARVTGQFQGTPVGSCVARAVRGARFPRFSRSTFQVSFPYRL